MVKKVTIFGAGIGGLTLAHQLAKYPDEYEVIIYEKKDAVGGMARSGRDSDGCATEYCWRVFFGFYDNFLGVLSEIPTPSGSTLDHLTEYKHKSLSDGKVTLRENISIIKTALQGLCTSDERMDALDNVSWWDALNTSQASHLFREIGGWLGMDRYKGSYRSVIKVGIEMHILNYILQKDYRDYITSQPTSEAIFNWWVLDLQRRGVTFKMNTELETVFTDGQIARSAVINGANGREIVDADYFAFAISVDALQQVIQTIPPLQRSIGSQINKLCDTCLHVQLAFQLYFNVPISLGGENAFLPIDSEWDIIVLSYDNAYKGTRLCNDPRVKGGWSVAVCTAYVLGLVYGKTMLECTYEEILVELWAQLKNCKSLQRLIDENNNFSLNENLVLKWSPMWPTYKFDNGIKTVEPKFTNNIGSKSLRPSYKTVISNLYISTAYINETIDIYSMEAACIAGKRVAREITGKSDPATIRERPKIFAPMRRMDSVAFKMGMPLWLFILLLCFLVFIAIKMVYSRK